MIAPDKTPSKGPSEAICRQKKGKTSVIPDHELVKTPHNNALFRSIRGHEALA
jgi:hypothetical protein